jgi:hypothetical protein
VKGIVGRFVETAPLDSVLVQTLLQPSFYLPWNEMLIYSGYLCTQSTRSTGMTRVPCININVRRSDSFYGHVAPARPRYMFTKNAKSAGVETATGKVVGRSNIHAKRPWARTRFSSHQQERSNPSGRLCNRCTST